MLTFIGPSLGHFLGQVNALWIGQKSALQLALGFDLAFAQQDRPPDQKNAPFVKVPELDAHFVARKHRTRLLQAELDT